MSDSQQYPLITKELSFCYKLSFSNPFIFSTRCCKVVLFQAYIIGSYRFYSLKYQTLITLGCKKIRIRKLVLGKFLYFDTKELSLCLKLKFSNLCRCQLKDSNFLIFANWRCRPLIFQILII